MKNIENNNISKNGISLITLVVTVIIILVLASTVVVIIIDNNPIKEAKVSKILNDVDNMQAIFDSTMANIAVKTEGTVKIVGGNINLVYEGVSETTGEVDFSVINAKNSAMKNAKIVFDDENDTEEKFYTGNMLPIYSFGETKWYVDNKGRISVKVDGVEYKNGEIMVEKGVNAPNLPAGATAVKWDENNVEMETTEYDEKWYDYIEQTSNTTNGGTSKWANCKLKDGSYFVWILRYAYKIDKTKKVIDVKFTKFENGTEVAYDGSSLDGYIVHPVFTSNVEAGGWIKELDGIWVAKYEAGLANSNNNTGDVEVSTNISRYKYPVFKPNRSSYVKITIGDSYQISKEYDKDSCSHLMKNSEWGAIAYLTHSKYGRNGTEVTINNSLITGNAANSVSASNYNETTITNAYDTNKGALASTTGNIYGIYDLSGGAWEKIAGYIYNGDECLSLYGFQIVNDGEVAKSNRYKTVYAYNSSSQSYANNYKVASNMLRVGEAVWETSTSGSGLSSWNKDYSYFLSTPYSFVGRGGYYSDESSAGIFAFNRTNGNDSSVVSFRIVLVK